MQLTAGHPFLEDAPPSLEPAPLPSTSEFDDVDFDGFSDQGDSEAEDLPSHFLNSDRTGSNASILGMQGMRSWLRGLGDITLHLRGGKRKQPEATLATPSVTQISSPKQPIFEESQEPPESVPIGHLMYLPSKGGLDYALIDVGGSHRLGFNQIPIGKAASGRHLRVTAAWEITQDVPVVTSTSSQGRLSGKLIATASYLRYPTTGQFHEVFPVLLEDGTDVVHGDCGSPVVDGLHGYFYGHIVAGTPGTGLAYIVPATKVVADIKTNLGEKEVHFTPPAPIQKRQDLGKLARKIRELRLLSLPQYQAGSSVQFVDLGSTRYFAENPPDVILEFASRSYFKDLEVMARYLKIKGNGSGSLAADPTWSSVSHPNTTKIARLGDLLRTANTETPPFPHAEYDHPVGVSRTSPRASGPKTLTTTTSSTFQNYFAALPVELQLHILSFVPISSLLSLRLASRPWYTFLTSQDTPLASAHLRQSHIPTFALSLFPLPPPTPPTLSYLSQLDHRYLTACRLSTAISDWITRDQFLWRKPLERAAFSESEALLRKRLVPLLLFAQHYFESYVRLLIDHPPSATTTEPELSHEELERLIMREYDNIALLQVTQFFPVLLTYQARRLRPPSYLGELEKPLRGYYRSDPVPEGVQVAMLYVGGLREVWRLAAGVQRYEKLRRAVDAWWEGLVGECEGASERRDRGKGKEVAPPVGVRVGPVGVMTRDETERVLGRLPAKSEIWVNTAEKVLLERGAVPRSQDIKRNGAVLQNLVLPALSWLDVLFYERGLDGLFDLGARV